MNPVNVIKKSTLEEFAEKYPDAATALETWYNIARQAVWMTPQDVMNRWANASIVANNRVVFNINGNNYRLVVAIAYKVGFVYIKFFGTHEEYDLIDATTVELE